MSKELTLLYVNAVVPPDDERSIRHGQIVQSLFMGQNWYRLYEVLDQLKADWTDHVASVYLYLDGNEKTTVDLYGEKLLGIPWDVFADINSLVSEKDPNVYDEPHELMAKAKADATFFGKSVKSKFETIQVIPYYH
jgi:hypothetical protein